LSGSRALLGVFLLAVAVEIAFPWRAAPTFAAGRWIGNLSLLVLTTSLDFLGAPIIAVLALAGLKSGLPLWVQLVVGVPALDALSYALHRAFHASPILWRLHALHHSDPELDVSTTVRHHPAETLLMMFGVGAFSAAVGLSPYVIGIYASLSLGVQFFAHANVSLPTGLANTLGRLVVTPAIHRVHHSRVVTHFEI